MWSPISKQMHRHTFTKCRLWVTEINIILSPKVFRQVHFPWKVVLYSLTCLFHLILDHFSLGYLSSFCSLNILTLSFPTVSVFSLYLLGLSTSNLSLSQIRWSSERASSGILPKVHYSFFSGILYVFSYIAITNTILLIYFCSLFIIVII